MWHKQGASRRTEPFTLEELTTESVTQRAIGVLRRTVSRGDVVPRGGLMKLDPRGSTCSAKTRAGDGWSSAAASSGVGRVAINGPQSPYVIPVNFTVVEGGIVIRLGTGWAAFHLDGAAVTFETDEATASRRSGWSVVVEGVARVVPYDDVARLGVNLPTPIVTEPGVRVFEIIPFKVTGRAVEPDLRGEQREPGAESPRHRGSREPALGQDAAEELAPSCARCSVTSVRR